NTGVKTTTLQVVKNFAWTFSYLACSLVALGMLVHFLIRLVTFLQARRKLAAVVVNKPDTESSTSAEEKPRSTLQKLERFFPFAIVALFALMLLGRSMTPSVRDDRMNLYGFGRIPVQHGGRIQPLDSVARNLLVVISGKQELDDAAKGRVYSAIEWLL